MYVCIMLIELPKICTPNTLTPKILKPQKCWPQKLPPPKPPVIFLIRFVFAPLCPILEFQLGWKSSNYTSHLKKIGRQPLMEDSLQWKTTSDGRRPPKEDNLQLKTNYNGRHPSIEDDLQWKITSNGRRPSMEDNLQFKMTSNGMRPPMEDKLTFNWKLPPIENNLKILKVGYISTYCIKTYEFLGGH